MEATDYDAGLELDSATRSHIEELIKGISFNGDNACADVEYDSDSKTWWTSVDIETAEGLEATFEVEFQYLVLPDTDESPPYIVLCWIVVPPDDMRHGPEGEIGLFRALNALNSEPGVKFRLSPEEDGRTSLVCEVDLPVNLLSQELIQSAFARSINMVAAYIGDLHPLAINTIEASE